MPLDSNSAADRGYRSSGYWKPRWFEVEQPPDALLSTHLIARSLRDPGCQVTKRIFYGGMSIRYYHLLVY